MGKQLKKNQQTTKTGRREITVTIYSCQSDRSWTLDKLELVTERLTTAITVFFR